MGEQSIALVTGANEGIGDQVAAGLGALGWAVRRRRPGRWTPRRRRREAAGSATRSAWPRCPTTVGPEGLRRHRDGALVMSPSVLNTTVDVGTAMPTISVRPVLLPAPGRGEDLQVRVSAPTTGSDLPVVVFSHGFGFSMDAYGPLADFWAAHGFVVVQPTHLDSVTLGLAPDDPRTPHIWRLRIEDLVRVLDELDLVAEAVPGLTTRMDRDRIAAAGHSYGATTASALLGARVLDGDGIAGPDMSDPRVSAGVLLALAGTGGEDLTPFAAESFPFMNPGFAGMATPALMTTGDHDQSLLSVRGPDWWTDGYVLSPGEKSLLTLFGAEHSQGGIDAYGGMPDPADSPALVALVQLVTTAYLRSALSSDGDVWAQVRAALRDDPDPLGRLESK